MRAFAANAANGYSAIATMPPRLHAVTALRDGPRRCRTVMPTVRVGLRMTFYDGRGKSEGQGGSKSWGEGGGAPAFIFCLLEAHSDDGTI